MTRMIRAGTVHDVRALIRMHDSCSQASIAGRYLAPLPMLGTRPAARLLCPDGGFSLVTERGHGLVGIVTVAPYDADRADPRTPVRAEVGQLVPDTWQRHGIGTALLLEAARRAAHRGIDGLVLTVRPDNPAALPTVHAAGLRAWVGTRDGLTQVRIGLAHLARGRGSVTRGTDGSHGTARTAGTGGTDAAADPVGTRVGRPGSPPRRPSRGAVPAARSRLALAVGEC